MDIDNKYGTLAIQKKLLSLMKVFHELCIQNDIKYISDSGTLLGAIRHDGFIPWDDDIDIVVDRENYEKLFKVDFSSYGLTSDRELWIDRIRFQDKNNFATIDILIMDKAPNSVFGRKVKFLSIAMLQGMLKNKPNYKGMSLPYKLLVASTYYTGKVFSKNVKLNLYSYISQYQKNKETQFVQCCSYMFKELQVLYPSNILDNLILHKFEDMEVYIPSNYDTYLKALYGDYMTPPSEENRKPIHVVVDNC